VRCSATSPTTKSNYPRGRDLPWLATICQLLRRLEHAGDRLRSAFDVSARLGEFMIEKPQQKLAPRVMRVRAR
jgi:hypothetical protein